ncbi:hypothetical protein PRIPAC_96091 [Pristionchus pacificus]|uniref:Uncharacterized protein n=1 Tax=Pristionchus pacificus TaxID=54126 RepID=A0A2A6BC45_PRIPA|nr:hypothetical protein PRIPAC_96091 [Pristionchus pacificus]|eukprot:PDM63462.1 hypothetical protein PRIPAC_53819 [Pristionchus pacificus]
MAIFIPVLIAAAVAIAITVTVVVVKDPPYSCYEKQVEGRLNLKVRDFRYDIIPSSYYECDDSRQNYNDPSSCYRTLTIQFDEREKAVILINMFEINTEYVDIHFKRLISDGFKGNHRPYCCQGISFTLVNYDLKSYTRTGWMEEPIYLDYYRDTARLEGVTRFLRWDNNPDDMTDESGMNPQITTGNITVTTTSDAIVPC